MPSYVRVATDDGPRYGVLEGPEVALVDRDPFVAHRATGERLPVETVRLLAPVTPTKVICVGGNYAKHVRKLSETLAMPAADDVLFFLKPSSSVVGPGEPILLPTDVSSEVHHEAELAAVIGRSLSRVTPDEALDGILGFTAANDVTARDVQRTEGQWFRAKGFDSFCPLGPAVSTELDTSALTIRCLVDGQVQQEGTTADLLVGIADLVSRASHVMTLLPGDVLLTGAPAEVGPLMPGQEVAVDIESIGVLANPIVDRMSSAGN